MAIINQSTISIQQNYSVIIIVILPKNNMFVVIHKELCQKNNRLNSALLHYPKMCSTPTQPFYGSLDSVWDNLREPVPEETFTHSHRSWSSVIPYLLHPSTTIHGILPVQFTCLTVFFHNFSLQVFFGLPLGLATSTSHSIHFCTFCNVCYLPPKRRKTYFYND